MSLNPIRPWRNIERRKSRQIMVGKVPVGGDAPISVQTMTNTNGHDVKATLAAPAISLAGSPGRRRFPLENFNGRCGVLSPDDRENKRRN